MQRLAFVLAALLALPADAGWQKVSSGWVKLSDGGGTSTPATCTTAGQLPFFLGSPLALGCDAGLTYDPATDALTVAEYVRTNNFVGSVSVSSPKYYVSSSGGDIIFSSGSAYDSGLRRVSPGLVGVTSGGSNLGSLQAGNVTAVALGTPAAVTITNQGTPGSTIYGYYVSAFLNDGTHSEASPYASTLTGNAVLDGTNFNRLTVAAVPNVAYYKWYRYGGFGSPSSEGAIGTSTTPTFDDTGLAADGVAGSATNTTGRILVGDGSAAAPSIALTSDPATGFYRVFAGRLYFVTGGANIGGFGAGGFFLSSGKHLTFGNNEDAFVSYVTAATLQLGASPNATPVLNTLLVGESGAGTDIAGGGGVVASAPGTGSGTPSVLTFKTPTVHGSDAVAQTLDTRLSLQEGHVNIPGLPVFADNTAAAALNVGDLYRTSTGVLMVRY